jgi:DNA invertase Pin-like site-specific DNA recombinase
MYKELSPTSAAAYVKMSIDHQSVGDQMDAIQNFAKRRGLKIVEAYSDGANQAEHSKPAKAQK